MSGRKTLIALALLVVLGGLYYLDAEQGKREIQEEMIAKRLFDGDAAMIEKVSLEVLRNEEGQLPAAHPFALARSEGGWRLTAPVEAAADPAAVDRIVGRIHGESLERTLEEPDALADYGLDPPRLVLRWWSESEEQPAIRIGDRSPTGSLVFALVDGRDGVLGLDSGILYDLSRKVQDLRDRTVLRFEEADVRRLEITREGQRMVVQRDGEGWKLTEPVDALAERGKVEKILRSLAALRIKLFVEDEPKDLAVFELAEPTSRVAVLTGEDGARHELLLGGETPTDGVFCRRGSSHRVFSIYASYTEDILPRADDLRDRQVLAFDRESVERLVLRGSHGPIELQLGGDGWRMVAPEERVADRAAANALLSNLEYMTAESFPTLEEVGPLPEPVVSMELASAGDEPRTWTLHLARAPEGVDGALAWQKPDGPLYLVAAEEIGRMDRSPLQLRDRLLLDFDRGAAKEITFTGGGQRILLRRKGDQWRLAEPADADLAPGAVDDIVWAVDYVEMERLASADELASGGLGLDPPRLEITVRESDDELRRLSLGLDHPEGELVYARSGTSDEVGLVRRVTLEDLLDHPLLEGSPEGE